MGKIRTKVLGSEEEAEQKKKDKARREGKKAQKKAHVSGMEGGARVVEMEGGPIIEETPIATPEGETPTPQPKKQAKPAKQRGRKYKDMKTFVDHTKKYSLSDAVKLAKKTSYTKFDGAIEVHFNTDEKGIRGTVTLPHGTGKKLRVAEASDELLKEIEKGIINFDILISTPLMMPKLAKVAKVLGPKGLMPNPKSGTITTEPEKLKEKLSQGQIQFKTENEAPIIHMVVGRVSFDEDKLMANLKSLVEAIGKKHILSLSTNCTMGPGIKVDLESI